MYIYTKVKINSTYFGKRGRIGTFTLKYIFDIININKSSNQKE